MCVTLPASCCTLSTPTGARQFTTLSLLARNQNFVPVGLRRVDSLREQMLPTVRRI